MFYLWIVSIPKGKCGGPTDCLDNPECDQHPMCDPKCKGDGCNHPNCENDPRCPLPENHTIVEEGKYYKK